MDPQATWNALLEEWREHSWPDVSELAEALMTWLDKGGFAPTVADSTKRVGQEWNRVMVRSACEFARQRADSVMNSPHGVPPDVPFIVACRECDADGPESLDEALDEGWTDFRYDPTSALENFTALCPHHRIPTKGGTSCPT